MRRSMVDIFKDIYKNNSRHNNSDYPSRDKLDVYAIVNRYSLKPYYPRYLLMAIMYKDGWDVNEIAEKFNVTRERVRQCLWKVSRRRGVK